MGADPLDTRAAHAKEHVVTFRRSVVIGSLALSAVVSASSAAVAAPGSHHEDHRDSHHGRHSSSVPSDSLRALSSRVGLRVGTAVNTGLLGSDRAYTRIVNQQFSTVTPENVMKWEVVEPKRGTYDWTAADRLVASAERNGQLVRGHTLVWHSQLPSWLNDYAMNLSREQVQALLKKHVQDQVRHFRGRIWQWDVVNEAFNEDGTLRNSIWLQKLGPDYIADAFRWAHEADPKAQLFYNDYNIEFTGDKSNAVYAMVKKLKAKGVPIDGVGFQTHLDTQYGYPDLRANLQRFANLGLNVAETEVDIRTFVEKGTTNTPESGLAQSAQEDYWSRTLQACLAVRRCISYTVWGVADHNSWVPGVFPGEGAALLWDEKYQPKPQYSILQEDLELAAGAPRRR
jgi:endo-1,4-beta-xylanase